MNRVDGSNQFIVQYVFSQVGAHTGIERTPDIFIAAVSAQRDNSSLRQLQPDGDDGFQAAGSRHAHVHEGDVRAMLEMQFHGLCAVGGFGHHVHIGLRVQNGLDTHSRNQVVLRDQDANHRSGTFTSTSVPCPGVLCSSSSPPNRSALSRIPSRPKWPPTSEKASVCSKPWPSSATDKRSPPFSI